MTRGTNDFHNPPDILEERLSVYLDDMLDSSERAELEAHLASCDTCQQQLAELRRVRALLRALAQPALPRSFLLPVEATTPTTSAESPVAPIPMRSSVRRQRTARVTRAAQWLGGIAAVLGLALLISTAVLGTRGGIEATSSAAPASGSATSAQSPTHDNQFSSPQMRTPTSTPLPRATAADTATGNNSGKSPEGMQTTAGPSPSHPTLLDLQLGGGALLLAGVALVVVSSLARRRRGLHQLAPPTAGN
jgi:hypothetical protein